jgi:hypothetical protein
VVQELVDPVRWKAHHLLAEPQDLAAGASGVLCGGVQEDSDLEAGVRQLGEGSTEDVCGAGGRRGEPGEDPERRGLPLRRWVLGTR